MKMLHVCVFNAHVHEQKRRGQHKNISIKKYIYIKGTLRGLSTVTSSQFLNITYFKFLQKCIHQIFN